MTLIIFQNLQIHMQYVMCDVRCVICVDSVSKSQREANIFASRELKGFLVAFRHQNQAAVRCITGKASYSEAI